MPNMDGLELLRHIRAHPPTAKIPFLMVTGEIERGRVAEAIKAGVTDFIAKPFISKALAERVENALKSGAGATYLPPGREPIRPLSRPAAERSSRRQRIILTVDDERDNIEIVAEALKPEYSVKAAINGRVALKAAAADPPPDLILLDAMMPELDGFGVCEQFGQDPATAQIPVIFISGSADPGMRARALSLGAQAFLVKPVQQERLLASLRAALGSPAQ
jgi:CheY-like chemotaxis protein